MTAVKSAALHAPDRTAVKAHVKAAAAATAGSVQQPPVAVIVQPGRRAAALPANLRDQYLKSLSVELETTADGSTGSQDSKHRREQEVLLLSQLYSWNTSASCTGLPSGEGGALRSRNTTLLLPLHTRLCKSVCQDWPRYARTTHAVPCMARRLDSTCVICGGAGLGSGTVSVKLALRSGTAGIWKAPASVLAVSYMAALGVRCAACL